MSILTSCGKVDVQKVRDLANEYPFKIRMAVDLKGSDMEINIWAKDVQIDREKMTVTVKDALTSSYYYSRSLAAIKVEGTFSFPLGGAIIEVWRNGQYERIETPAKQ